MILKVLAFDAFVSSLVLAVSNVIDGTAERVILYSAAAGVVWFKVLRPFVKLVWRTVHALEVFESLPELNERVAAVEAEVGLVQHGQQLQAKREKRIQNLMHAIVRELGIEPRVIAGDRDEDDD